MSSPFRLAPMLACLGLVTACGGGGGLDDALESPPTPAEATAAAARTGAVKTLAEARAAASLMLPSLLPSTIRTSGKSADDDGLGAPPYSRQGAAAKAVQACADGGTVADSVQASFNAGSPYTSRTFDLDVLTYDLCKETRQEETQTVNVATNGVTKSGVVIEGEGESGVEVEYSQVGESANRPRRSSLQYQSKSGVSPPFAYTINSENFGVNHRRFSGGDIDTQRFTNLLGTLSGTLEGSRVDGAFVVRRGISDSSGNRFIRTFGPQGSVYQGTFASALLSLPANLTSACGKGGTFAISTVTPLYDADDGEGQLFTGTVRLSAAGDTATYVFSNTGFVEITAGDGTKTTISQEALMEDCPIMVLYR